MGEGLGVLLLHAFPLNSRMWQPQLDALRGKARMIAPDLPGFGLSPSLARSPTIEAFATAVIDLLDAIRVRSVVVVGESMGGYVALRLVASHPNRVEGLLLASTHPGTDDEETVARRLALAAEVEATGVAAAADALLPRLFGATTHRARPALVDGAREIILENRPRAVADALSALAGRVDSTDMLPAIRCPTTCLAGKEDAVTPPVLVGAMASAIPGARFQAFDNAGHLVSLEAPAAFNEALADLLDRCAHQREQPARTRLGSS